MLMMEGWMPSSTLHFPVRYTLALPAPTASGERVPAVFLLHDLTQGADVWRDHARLAMLVEKHRLALVMPEGRRSCFLDMAYGPCWNMWLREELPAVLGTQLCLDTARAGFVGVGTGALGVMQLAAEDRQARFACVAIDPDVLSPFGRTQNLWPNEHEWTGVFFDKQEMWRPERFAGTRGALMGSTAARAAQRYGLHDWTRLETRRGGLEAKLDGAIEYCAEVLRRG